MQSRQKEKNVVLNAVAAGTSGSLSGAAAAAGVLIICSTPISAPCVIIAGCLGGLVGMYFGKDAESVMGAIGKGILTGAITGATVALSYVAVNKLLETMAPNSAKAMNIKGKERMVEITKGSGKRGVTVTVKHEAMIPRSIKNSVIKPQHSYVVVKDNLTGKYVRYDLNYDILPDGKKIIQILNDGSGTEGSTIIRRTICGTGKGAKGTNKHLFKMINKQISKLAKKSYNGKIYDKINKSCQTFASDAFDTATMGLCKGEHLAKWKSGECCKGWVVC